MTRAVVVKRRRRAEYQRQHPTVYMAPAGTSPLDRRKFSRIGRLAGAIEFTGWSGRAG